MKSKIGCCAFGKLLPEILYCCKSGIGLVCLKDSSGCVWVCPVCLRCSGHLGADTRCTMHLLPHVTVSTGYSDTYCTLLRNIMDGKILQEVQSLFGDAKPTWDMKAAGLLQILQRIPHLHIDRRVTHTNDVIQAIGRLACGRLRDYADEEGITEDEKQQRIMEHTLTSRSFCECHMLQEEHFLAAYKVIIDSEVNCVRARKFWEVTWDMCLWIPLYDASMKTFRMWCPALPDAVVDEKCSRYVRRYFKHAQLSPEECMQFVSEVPTSNSFQQTAAVRKPSVVPQLVHTKVLKQWYAKCRTLNGIPLDFPQRVSRTIIHTWSAAVFQSFPDQPEEVNFISVANDAESPVCEVPSSLWGSNQCQATAVDLEEEEEDLEEVDLEDEPLEPPLKRAREGTGFQLVDAIDTHTVAPRVKKDVCASAPVQAQELVVRAVPQAKTLTILVQFFSINLEQINYLCLLQQLLSTNHASTR
eukprot:4127098-Amphidinium_carterae.1